MDTAQSATSLSPIFEKIDEFLDYLKVEKGSSPLTIRNYRHYLSRFENWLTTQKKDHDLSDIDQEIVRKYRLYLSELSDGKGGQLGRRTQSYHAIALRSFLKYLLKRDFEVLAPDKIDLPKVPDRQIKFMSAEHMERLLNAPTLSNIQGIRDKAILETLYSTGLRVSEIVSLNRDKLNLENGEFGVVGKGGKARVVFLSPNATEWLKKYLAQRADHFNPLFIRHKGKIDPTTPDEKMRLTPRSMQRMVKKYVKKVKIPIDATVHTIRHGFATDLLMAGADLRSVQEMLGHKNVSTTQIYTHVTNKQLKDIHSAFHGKGGK